MPVAAERAWTDEQIELLKAQWKTTNSCNWIAGEINRLTGSNFTRNAIIGKVHRMGLSKRVIERQPSQPKPKKPRNRRIRPARRVVVDLFPDVVPVDFLGVPFVETTNETCMYPEGDGAHMLFCGQPRKDESSYCPVHHAICHQKPTGPTIRYWKTWGRAA